MKRFVLPVTRPAGALCVLATFGCAGPAPRPPSAPVELSETLPAGYVSLGIVSAGCRPRPSARSFRGEPATSFACTARELSRALREQTNARGGTLLAGEACHSEDDDRLICSAEAARLAGPQASVPAGEFADAGDALRVTVAGRIRIDLGSAPSSSARRQRGPDDVTEFASLPVGHGEVGVMRAHCAPSDCDVDEARAGLRLAAGGLGVSDLVGVRCFSLDGERACVATLAMTERDPDTDPLAR